MSVLATLLSMHDTWDLGLSAMIFVWKILKQNVEGKKIQEQDLKKATMLEILSALSW
jgi:hypothetical protein